MVELVRQKNVATIIAFPLVDADGDLVSASANPDSEIDAWSDTVAPDGFADCTNEATEIGATGIYYLSLTQSEMNNDYIVIQIKSDDAKTQVVEIRTMVGDPLLLATTTSGTTIDVESGGTVGVDLSNVNGTLDAGEIGANAITADKIATDAITADKIAANAITSSELADGAITAAKIATDAITADKIAANAITSSELADGAITADKIATDAITAAKIAANAITSSELADGAITADKIATDAITAAKIAANAITSTEIADGAITADKIAANAITAAKIATDAIAAAKIASDAVTKIQNGLATAAALTTVDSIVDAIKLVTDALPDSGALTTITNNIAAILTDTGTTLDGKIDAIDDYIDTEITAIIAELLIIKNLSKWNLAVEYTFDANQDNTVVEAYGYNTKAATEANAKSGHNVHVKGTTTFTSNRPDETYWTEET